MSLTGSLWTTARSPSPVWTRRSSTVATSPGTDRRLWTPRPSFPSSSPLPADTKGRSLPRGSDLDVLGDDRLEDLAGAAVDPGDPGVGVQARDRVLQDVTVAAVQLEALVDHARLYLGAEQLGDGRIGGRELPDVQRLDRAVH